jgi:hypothetical protein
VQKVYPPVKFEDFENGSIAMSYSYANTGGLASMGKFNASKDEKHTGVYSAVAKYDTGINTDWGCGAAFTSNYGKDGYIDATGRTKLSMWVKAPENQTFYFFVNEANANGADGEYYNSPIQTGSGKWQYYEVPFDEFYKNIYSGNQAGDNDLDSSGISTVGIQFGGAEGKGNVYIDDVWFK